MFGSQSGWNDPPERSAPKQSGQSTIAHLRNKTKKPVAAPAPTSFTPMQPDPMNYPMANGAPFQPQQNGQGGGFPGFTKEQERIIENQRVSSQAMASAAGPPPRDTPRSRLQSRTSSTSEADQSNFSLTPDQQKMKNVFTSLLQKCKASPVLQAPFKRKLDDVERRLTQLYEKLVSGGLSLAVVDGLQKMSQLAEQKQYPQAVDVHRQIVQSANFSQISAFMPGLKVLLQISYQLGI